MRVKRSSCAAATALLLPAAARADEARLVLPDLGRVQFLGMSGRSLLLLGLLVCALGGVFGLIVYQQLKRLAVHRSMLEVSELIYETCKTYLITQGKFILILEAFIGVIMVVYFGWLRHFDASKVIAIIFIATTTAMRFILDVTIIAAFVPCLTSPPNSFGTKTVLIGLTLVITAFH